MILVVTLVSLAVFLLLCVGGIVYVVLKDCHDPIGITFVAFFMIGALHTPFQAIRAYFMGNSTDDDGSIVSCELGEIVGSKN